MKKSKSTEVKIMSKLNSFLFRCCYRQCMTALFLHDSTICDNIVSNWIVFDYECNLASSVCVGNITQHFRLCIIILYMH